MTSATPNPIDIAVGQRVRAVRELRGLTQNDLAKATGVTFQQIQKYERGTNRVSASRLMLISHALGQPVSTFFEPDEPGARDGLDLFAVSGSKALLEAYGRIETADQRRIVVALARSLASDPAA